MQGFFDLDLEVNQNWLRVLTSLRLASSCSELSELRPQPETASVSFRLVRILGQNFEEWESRP